YRVYFFNIVSIDEICKIVETIEESSKFVLRTDSISIVGFVTIEWMQFYLELKDFEKKLKDYNGCDNTNNIGLQVNENDYYSLRLYLTRFLLFILSSCIIIALVNTRKTAIELNERMTNPLLYLLNQFNL
ncbi:hypothetical protein RFI_34841, partial [Reticulomyxa filosa]